MIKPRLLFTALGLVLLSLAQANARDTHSDWETLKTKYLGVDERMRAVRSLIERANGESQCGQVVAQLIEFALKPATPPPLQKRIAAEIFGCSGEGTVRVLLEHMGRGQAPDREFILRASRNVHAPEIDKALIAKGLSDDDSANRRAALDILVFHACAAAVPALESIYKSGKDPTLVEPAIAGISTLLADTQEWTAWEARLIELARGTGDEQRRAALMQLARSKDAALIEVFVQALAHTDWSTRAIALEYLAACESKGAVRAIVAQMQHEPPGSRMSNECRRVLERLSGGMNFGERAEDWAAWWRNNEAEFTFVHASAPRTPDPKPASPPSETHVSPTFYGLQVESERVCFVIDVSGSMNEPARGTDGETAARIDVARRELTKIIGELPPGALFNIISFNADVESWIDKLGDAPRGVDTRARKVPSTGDPREKGLSDADKEALRKQREAEQKKKLDDELRDKARAWVQKLAADGATNLNDALELAFSDPEIDTIFLLTDGEPTVGKRIDPEAIRSAVRGWNSTRHIKLNTIAIGTEQPLVMQLAQDNGGQYRFSP